VIAETNGLSKAANLLEQAFGLGRGRLNECRRGRLSALAQSPKASHNSFK
jgi:hypothetical protein